MGPFLLILLGRLVVLDHHALLADLDRRYRHEDLNISQNDRTRSSMLAIIPAGPGEPGGPGGPGGPRVPSRAVALGLPGAPLESRVFEKVEGLTKLWGKTGPVGPLTNTSQQRTLKPGIHDSYIDHDVSTLTAVYHILNYYATV